MIPPPLVCSLADGNVLLLAQGLVYQPAKKESDSYVLHGNRRVHVEPTLTLQDLNDAYWKHYEPLFRQLKQQHLDGIRKAGADGIQELEQKLQGDAFKLWYVTEVQNVYLDSIDCANELEHLERRAKKEKKAYLNALRQIEKQPDEPSFSLEFPKYTLFLDKEIIELKRRFFSRREPVAVVSGNSFVAAREIDHLDRFAERTCDALERRLQSSWEKEDGRIADVAGKLRKFKSAFASGLAERNGFEYHNLGFGSCDKPLVYLRSGPGSNDAVAVYLEMKDGKITFCDVPFAVQIENGTILRKNNICVTSSDFEQLHADMKHLPDGARLIRFLHNVRDHKQHVEVSSNDTTDDYSGSY